MTTQVSLETVAALLQTYGADPGRWPPELRAPAAALLAAQPALTVLAADERALDDDLVLWPAHASRPEARAALVARARVTPQEIAPDRSAPAARSRGWRRGLVGAGGLVAAGLAVALVATPNQAPVPLKAIASAPVAAHVAAPAVLTDDDALRMVFSEVDTDEWL